MFLADGITIAHHLHLSSGELWCAVLAFLVGLLVGIHMSQPRWIRRE